MSNATLRYPDFTLEDKSISLYADVLSDLEKSRIANENRLRSLTRHEFRGEEGGYCLDCDTKFEKGNHVTKEGDTAKAVPISNVSAKELEEIVGFLAESEKKSVKALQNAMKRHPLYKVIKEMPGVGDKQAARLLSCIGDPFLDGYGMPISLGQLWTYCGHGNPALKRFKGMTQEDLFKLGNPEAKSRLWLISNQVRKCGIRDGKPQNDLVKVYFDRKESTKGKLHDVECRRCGPSGKPAQPGDPWSDGHRDADALRVLGKHILDVLWTASRDLHAEAQGVSIEEIAELYRSVRGEEAAKAKEEAKAKRAKRKAEAAERA